jgi:hypothetical protein
MSPVHPDPPRLQLDRVSYETSSAAGSASRRQEVSILWHDVES